MLIQKRNPFIPRENQILRCRVTRKRLPLGRFNRLKLAEGDIRFKVLLIRHRIVLNIDLLPDVFKSNIKILIKLALLLVNPDIVTQRSRVVRLLNRADYFSVVGLFEVMDALTWGKVLVVHSLDLAEVKYLGHVKVEALVG